MDGSGHSGRTTGPPGWMTVGATGIFLSGIVVLVGLALWLQRGFSFVADEWDVLAHYVDGHYLVPYNGHLSLIPVAIYQGLAATVGIDSYRAYGLVGIVVFSAIPVAFFASHRRHIDIRLLAVASLGIAWSWAAEWNLLYGFLVNFNLPLLMLVLAWPLVRRSDLRADLGIVAAAAVALASSSVGVVVVFALFVELLLGGAPLRRLLRLAPPVAIWLVWWVLRHEATKPATLGERISYAWHLLVAIFAGFTLGWPPGAILSVAAIGTVVMVAWKKWRTLDAHVIAIGATIVFFVLLSAYSRAGDIALNPPDAARYVWLGDLLIIAALVWCVRGRRLPPIAPLVAAVVVTIGAVGLIGHMRDYRHYILAYGDRTRPFLAGAEAAGPRADQSRFLPLNLIPVTVAEYLELVERRGSPVAGVPLSGLGSPEARRAADQLLISDEGLQLRPTRERPACARSWSPVDLQGHVRDVDPGSIVMFTNRSSSEAAVRVRRFATGFATDPVGRIPAGSSARLDFPTDGSDLAWAVSAPVSVETSVCRGD